MKKFIFLFFGMCIFVTNHEIIAMQTMETKLSWWAGPKYGFWNWLSYRGDVNREQANDNMLHAFDGQQKKEWSVAVNQMKKDHFILCSALHQRCGANSPLNVLGPNPIRYIADILLPEQYLSMNCTTNTQPVVPIQPTIPTPTKYQ